MHKDIHVYVYISASFSDVSAVLNYITVSCMSIFVSQKRKEIQSNQFYFEYYVLLLLSPSIKYHTSIRHVTNRNWSVDHKQSIFIEYKLF